MNTIFLKLLVPAAMLGAMTAPMAAQAAPYDHHNVNARLHRQHERIVQGVRSGELTHREAHHLERREVYLHRQEHYLRYTGGHLSPHERARLHREENHSSHAIYRQKHDWQVR